jgi:hypothetical protein
LKLLTVLVGLALLAGAARPSLAAPVKQVRWYEETPARTGERQWLRVVLTGNRARVTTVVRAAGSRTVREPMAYSGTIDGEYFEGTHGNLTLQFAFTEPDGTTGGFGSPEGVARLFFRGQFEGAAQYRRCAAPKGLR